MLLDEPRRIVEDPLVPELLILHALDAAHRLRLHCRTASEVLAQLRELLEPALMDVAALGRA